ncbi:MAG: glutathione S-transferase N-terminal domain-containing protein [Gammaproteobacteria bacterium]|nr:glutathione S-transferase N-terminal domain-containing protein [Gammaproteobacteria bacterium]MDH5777980.1 glutathione S-transferase N-terminal domain-containing protein [Gammaproteobacteria bacterium]
MAQMANRRLAMTLFSADTCPYCHIVRIVLAEKGISFEVTDVDINNTPEDLKDLNPYNEAPTLVDRDLVLYDHRVIMEYLDERFPHPPLMPVDPVSRARNRLMLHRIERDWFTLVDKIANNQDADAARKELRDSLVGASPIFDQKPFFMSDEFTLMDCVLAPLLWRLPQYGIELPAVAKPLIKYAERMFERGSFQESLTEGEKEIRQMA